MRDAKVVMNKKILITIGILIIAGILIGCWGEHNVLILPTTPTKTGFVTVCGNNFCLNGERYRFVGANVHWRFLSFPHDEIDRTFEEASKLGIKVIRVWLWDPQSYPEARFGDIDYILDSARRHDIKLIIVLASHDGIVKYRIRAHPELEGENPRELREGFFEDVEANELYRNFVHNLITRTNSINGVQYKEDPTIFSWELMNEPDCASPPSLDVLTEWIEETSSYIKSMDQNHMIATGSGHVSDPNIFLDLHTASNISFCTFHFYPAHFKEITEEKAREIIDNLIGISIEIGKPVVMEEYGTSRRWGLDREVWYSLMLDEFYSKNGDGTAFWLFTARSNLTEEELRIENGISMHPDDAELREIIKEKAEEIYLIYNQLQHITSVEEKEIPCAKEGERVNRNPLLGPTDQKCCLGLIEVRVSKSYSVCEKRTDNIKKEKEPMAQQIIENTLNIWTTKAMDSDGGIWFFMLKDFSDTISPADGVGCCPECERAECRYKEPVKLYPNIIFAYDLIRWYQISENEKYLKDAIKVTNFIEEHPEITLQSPVAANMRGLLYIKLFEVTKEEKYKDKAIDILNKEERIGRMSGDAFRIFTLIEGYRLFNNKKYLIEAKDFANQCIEKWENDKDYVTHPFSMVAALTELCSISGDQRYLNFAEYKMQKFIKGYYDTTYGGFYYAEDMPVKESRKNFEALLALSKLYTATNNEEYLDLANKTLDFIYKYLYDHKYGGIAYICERDGSPIGTYTHYALFVNSSKIKTSESNSFAAYVLLEYLEDRRIEKIKENCTDGIDNDKDGKIDCSDSDCFDNPVCLIAPPVALAFPTAEGFGANTVGGRGGRIIYITNLNDSGPGSLREALEQEGARIIIFKVGGVIELKDEIIIKQPYVTIAGQTASGDGICLKNAGLSIFTHDVIVRHLRIRPGDSNVGSSYNDRDAIKINGYNIILDHISASWSIDEVISIWDSHDVTIQWSIFSEALLNSFHPKGKHSMGMLIRNNVKNLCVHHNIFAHNNERNPRVGGDVSLYFANNIIYNWGHYGSAISASGVAGRRGNITLGPISANIINNYYKKGPDSKGEAFRFGKLPDDSKVFLNGNIGLDGIKEYPFLSSTLVTPDAGIELQEANKSYNLVLEEAGATIPIRDKIDKRIVIEVKNRTGKIIDSPIEVGGYPIYKSGIPPLDTDNDGIPDDWENTHGLNPQDPTDGNKDRDKDGYTNIEEYLNELAGDND